MLRNLRESTCSAWASVPHVNLRKTGTLYCSAEGRRQVLRAHCQPHRLALRPPSDLSGSPTASRAGRRNLREPLDKWIRCQEPRRGELAHSPHNFSFLFRNSLRPELLAEMVFKLTLTSAYLGSPHSPRRPLPRVGSCTGHWTTHSAQTVGSVSQVRGVGGGQGISRAQRTSQDRLDTRGNLEVPTAPGFISRHSGQNALTSHRHPF